MLREQALGESLADKDGGVVGDGCARWEPWRLVDTLYLQRMRTRSDRDALLSRFQEAFPEAFLERSSGRSSERSSEGSPARGMDDGDAGCVRSNRGGIGTHPMLRVTPQFVQIGNTCLPRGVWAQTVSGGGGSAVEGLKAGVPLAFALRRPFHALARSVFW